MLFDEFRRAVRAIARRPATSALVVVTMALGIGATTAVFSVVDAVLLRSVPFHNPDELVELWTQDPDGSAYPRLDAERAEAWTSSSLFARVERHVDKTMLLGGVTEPEEVRAAFVSPTIFQTLGVAPAVGRSFTVDDDRPDAPLVAIVSEDFRVRHLADRPIGKSEMIRLDDKQFVVVGVMPASFRYPRGIVSVWIPLHAAPAQPTQQPSSQLNYLARLRPGVSQASARELFADFSRRLNAASPRKEGWAVAPMFVNEPSVSGDVRQALWVLAAAVTCLMLIACVNAANLLLMQASTRQRELAIRGALGASRRRLVGHLLGEAMTLAVLAAGLGVVAAYWAVELIAAILPKELAIFGNGPVEMDARVLAFAVAAGSVTWLLCGVGPALQASKARASLVSGDRSNSGGRRARRVRAGLVVTELALSLMLLAGAGLFTMSLVRLLHVDPGFDARHVLIANLGIPSSRFPQAEQRAALLADIERRVEAVPGVRGTTFATGLPPQAGVTFGSRLEAEGASVPARSGEVTVPFAEVDSQFFSTLGVPMLRGRSFTREDLSSSARVAVIDPQFAAALWPNDDPLGRRFRFDADRPWITVVGVSGDLKLMGADDRKFPFEIYYPRPINGRATRYVAMAIRTTGDPAALIAGVKRAIRQANPDQPISTIVPAEEAFAESVAKPKFVLVLMSCFAALALALSVVGVYGVLSYAVVQRTREIGIRMALGARGSDVLRAMLIDGVRLAVLGISLGLIGVMATSRLVTSLLFDVVPNDAVALVGASVSLAVVALCAVLVPALRASRVNPLAAISVE